MKGWGMLVSFLVVLLCFVSSSGLTPKVQVLSDEAKRVIGLNASLVYAPRELPSQSQYMSKMPKVNRESKPLFISYVLNLQRNCSKPVKFVRAHPHGYGAMINYAMLAATASWIRGHRAVFVPDDHSDEAKSYFDPEVCDLQRHKKNIFACLFKRLTPDSCKEADNKAYQELVLGMKNPYLNPMKFEDLRTLRDIVTQQNVFRETTVSPWFWTQVNSLLFQLNSNFVADVNEQMAKDSQAVKVSMSRFNSEVASDGDAGEGAEVFVCLHMRGAEKFFDTQVISPEVYVRAALQKIVSLKLKSIAKVTQHPYILLISEDEDRTRLFKKLVGKASSRVPVVTLNPIQRHDSRKYLHVTQMVAAMNKCANADAVIATISSNIARLLLYGHVLRNKGRGNATFVSLDRWQLMFHAGILESPPMIDITKPPFYPT